MAKVKITAKHKRDRKKAKILGKLCNWILDQPETREAVALYILSGGTDDKVFDEAVEKLAKRLNAPKNTSE